MLSPHDCDVFDWIQKVQKASIHDFWIYRSVLGVFTAKIHFATRAADFCQLTPILSHVGVLFLTGMKEFKEHENMIFGHIGVF